MSHTKERAFTLEGEAALSRNTGKTQALREGGRLLPPDKEASFLAPLIAAGQTGTAGLRTCRLGRQAASPGNPERQLGTGKAVFSWNGRDDCHVVPERQTLDLCVSVISYMPWAFLLLMALSQGLRYFSFFTTIAGQRGGLYLFRFTKLLFCGATTRV